MVRVRCRVFIDEFSVPGSRFSVTPWFFSDY
jgi:hypothetical protein